MGTNDFWGQPPVEQDTETHHNTHHQLQTIEMNYNTDLGAANLGVAFRGAGHRNTQHPLQPIGKHYNTNLGAAFR